MGKKISDSNQRKREDASTMSDSKTAVVRKDLKVNCLVWEKQGAADGEENLRRKRVRRGVEWFI